MVAGDPGQAYRDWGNGVISAYISWGLNPTYQRLALLKAKGALADDGQLLRVQRQEVFALRLMLGTAVIILLLTAWARVS
jgi:hypothetical protein